MDSAWNPALIDPTPRATFIQFTYAWTPGGGTPFGATTDITLTITDPFDRSIAASPDPIFGTFETGNSGDGTWAAWHNEQGKILVWWAAGARSTAPDLRSARSPQMLIDWGISEGSSVR